MSTAAAKFYVEVEPALMQQAEEILGVIGMTFSQAVNLFVKQMVLHREFPVKLSVPADKTLYLEDMTDEEVVSEFEKGMEDIKAGRCYTSEEMMGRLTKHYGIKF